MESLNLKKCCEQLLDMGKRNRLLYFSYGRSYLKVLFPSSEMLFNAFVSGKKFSFFDVDNFFEKNGISDEASFEKYGDEVFVKATAALPKNEILSWPKDFSHSVQRLLRTLTTNAQDSLSERGINTLYFAFGFLCWKDKNEPELAPESPLLLIPVTLAQQIGKPFEISANDGEDVKINSSLLFKLRSDYSLELPAFFEGETLQDYLEAVKECISNQNGWTVCSKNALGLFSFDKLDMYEDLKNNENCVLDNPIIQSLFSGTRDQNYFENNIDSFDPKEWEVKLHNVVDADSSQIQAIAAAKSSKCSFVLQGPPGTGKSQTITNIIAESLYDGKRVLFVSEKMAALEVVYKKLANVGLSDFCLELHAKKSNKKAVASELLRTLNLDTIAVTEKADETIKEYHESREALNEYETNLHQVLKPIELSPFSLMALADKYSSAAQVTFCFQNIESYGQNFLKESLENIQKITREAKILGNIFLDNPMADYSGGDSYEEKVLFSTASQKVQVAFTQISQVVGTSGEMSAYVREVPLLQLFNTVKSVQTLLSVSRYSSLFKETSKVDEINVILQNRALILQEKNRLEKELGNHLKCDYILADNLINFGTDFSSTYRNPLSRLSKKYRLIKETFYNDSTHSYRINYKEMCSVFTSQQFLVEQNKQLAKIEHLIIDKVPSYKNDTDFVELTQDTASINSVPSSLRQALLQCISETNFASMKKEAYLSSFCKTDFDTIMSFQQFFSLRKVSDESINSFSSFIDLVKQAIAANLLDDWSAVNACISKAKQKNYFDFVVEYLHKVNADEAKIEGMEDSFLRVFYTQWADYAYRNKKSLCSLDHVSHDKVEKRFQELDHKAMLVSSSEIRAAVSSKFPKTTSQSFGGFAKLKMEVSKKRCLLPVRQLLKRYEKEIAVIKPCFMMSPLSVSSLLDSNQHFDLVVFDEASQVFPWDAIGSIYRSSQVIISGDPKQMPPTNFFNTRLEDDDDEDEDFDSSSDVAKFESIIQYFAAFPQYSLSWHYRSRCEDLIAFSNKNFYGNNLTTFPSAIKPRLGFGIDFVYVPNGVYQRKSRVNVNEAKKVANLVYDCYKNAPKKSVGIVAFNIAQQSLISDEIDSIANHDSGFATYLSKNKDESVFVKNLETVQGDERDIIILSIGYAKDQTGSFIMNFGPLNKDGGERRLNVAITRARENIKVVSSVHYFDFKKTNSRGCQLLCDYLRFAETKNLDMVLPTGHRPLDFESPFEESVYRVLTDAGYKVDTQVGCSGYRIDLGVKNSNESAYVLGIECDGKTYHSGKCTRDRDRLRQEVLESKGWTFYRIWSTDWFRSFDKEKERLLSAVEAAINSFDSGTTDTQEESETAVSKDNFETVKAKPSLDLKSFFTKYVSIFDQDPNLTIFSQQGIDSYSHFLLNTVQLEEPIKENVLLRRFAKFSGREKVTNVVRNYFENAKTYVRDVHMENDFYFIENSAMTNPMRIGGDRTIFEIPTCELRNGIMQIVKVDEGLSERDLCKELLSLFDIKKMSAHTEDYLASFIKEMENKQLLEKDEYGSLRVALSINRNIS